MFGSRSAIEYPIRRGSGICLGVLLAWLAVYHPADGAVGQLGVQCHIHPPDQPAGESGVFGSYASAEQCERDNAKFYNGRGRCHCVERFDMKSRPSPPGGDIDPQPVF